MSDVNATLPEITVTAKKFVPAPEPPVPPTPAQETAGQTAPAGPINDPTGPQTAVRQPLVRVLYNGQALAGVVSADVENNSYYATDHFHVTFAASASPPGWWDIEPPLRLDTQFSLNNGGSWTSLLIGEVDEVELVEQTGTLTMSGRDLSAEFIEAKTQEAFVNQTSSQVAETLAARHGFMTNIQATTGNVGRFYESDHVRGSLDQFAKTTTEWELLVYLAQREGFDVFMTGTTLNFVSITPPEASPYVIQWTPPSPVPRLNTTTLRLKRSLTLAKDVQVQVRSWNSQQGRGFTKTTRASGTRRPNAGTKSTTQNYSAIKPNMTEEQAQAAANQLAIDLTRHERLVFVDMAGDLTLTPRTLVAIRGTGTSFDQSYYVSEIERSISFAGGYTQRLSLKNSSPRSMVQLA